MTVNQYDYGLWNVANGIAQRSACGCKPISIRGAGIITNAEVDVATINVGMAAMINLFVKFTNGALTSATLTPKFLLTEAGTDEYGLMIGDVSAGGSSIKPMVANYAFTTGSMNVIIPIVNPGAEWFKLKLKSVGTTTNSEMLIAYTIGWGNDLLIQV